MKFLFGVICGLVVAIVVPVAVVVTGAAAYRGRPHTEKSNPPRV